MASEGTEAPSTEVATGRSLIVDETSFEEQFLRCQVCREKYEIEERPAKSLPCNHSFCLPCLKQVFDHSQPAARRTLLWGDETLDGTLKCPQCRVEIYLSRGEIKKLPNDHRVIQMIDFLSQAVVKSKNVCSKHENQSLNFFCKLCMVPVCRDCTVLDHKEQQGHSIVDVTDALSENSEEFNEVENKSKQSLDRMKTRSDSLANASKRLDLLERKLRVQIKDTFIEYRLLLERRQEALTSMLQQQVKEQKNKINTRFYGVSENVSELGKIYESFVEARASNDIKNLFALNDKMKEKEEEFSKSATTDDDDELFVASGFEVPNEGAFLSEMSMLGEISSNQDLQLKQPVPAHQLYIFDLEERQERVRQFQRSACYVDCDDYLIYPATDYPQNTVDSGEEQEPDILDAEAIEAITQRIMDRRSAHEMLESEHAENNPRQMHGRRGRNSRREILVPATGLRVPSSSNRERSSRENRNSRRPDIQVVRHQLLQRLQVQDEQN
ncbi:E3 ubiquitin-protein ligase TRIM63-like [Gigantopelta aegis]|uniref:E3 ubiquitin-protein ligase TRIM63-like n=1 Tax=Gigantopelta aegis TaxID=1735272 RepID=UPI001B88BED7|nr:E3 ubiquitin-protein ligase TRIM63-like [Gigantopelta aegis]XP_041358727.1 E3 ubiquitin-protein ligase TRIM63-like [Gigantopelta aegis]